MVARNSKHDPIPALSDAEWEVMKPFWENGPMAARDVYAALPEGHGWAIKTVKTLLARLVAKGALAYEQIGNSYLYRAACSREDVTRREMESFVGRVLDGSLSPVLAHFIERTDLSPAEVERLKALLDAKGGADGKKKGGQ